ncbi:MAG: DUF1284 domain-containing protein [Phycisphaerae bacterium]|nr:DUF1284 domain-containing protein [Phycisphaerae bacterium]
MDEKPLAVRTHHLMCVSRGALTGSKHPTLSPLLELIRKEPGRLIRVVVGPDDICIPCPYWNGTECARSEGMEAMNRRKDQEFLEVLGMSDGQVMNAREMYDLIGRRITLEALRWVCRGGCKPDECYEAAKDPSVIFGR